MALARKPFVVIDAEILSSSVWSEAAHVRLVWLTLLILCDTEGNIGAAIPGIARAAGVSLEEAEDAMRRLQDPDPYSRTKENDGRRIVQVERGWRIFNFSEALARLSKARASSRERMRRFRDKKRTGQDKKRKETRVTNESVTVTAGNREQGIENNGNELTSAPNGAVSVPESKTDADAVLDHWIGLGGNVREAGVRRKYLARINARLKDGFSVSDLKQCADFAWADSFYLKKKYHKQPDVIWRDAERVAGILAKHVPEADLPGTKWGLPTRKPWEDEEVAK